MGGILPFLLKDLLVFHLLPVTAHPHNDDDFLLLLSLTSVKQAQKRILVVGGFGVNPDF